MNHSITSRIGSFCRVLFENESLLAIEKPAGTPSQPLKPDETETAVGSALAHYPQLPHIPQRPLEKGLLHRLDVGTSGVLLFAKTEDAFHFWVQNWNQIRKYYIARVQKPLASLPLRLDREIGHSLKSQKKMVVLSEGKKPRTNIRGKPQPAITIIQKCEPSGRYFNLTIEIQSGVRHQIRAHLADAHSPIIGDEIYKGPLAERLFLHSWRLEIPGPDDRPILIEAPLPW